MGFVAHSTPNYTSAKQTYGIAPGPVKTATLASYSFYERISDMMNTVHAYGGATIFP